MKECQDPIHDMIESPKEWSPKWQEVTKVLRDLSRRNRDKAGSARYACGLMRMAEAEKPSLKGAHVLVLVLGEESLFPIISLADGKLQLNPGLEKVLPKADWEALKEFV